MRRPLPSTCLSLLVLALAADQALHADAVTAKQAHEAAKRFMAGSRRPMGEVLPPEVEQVIPHADAQGRVLFYEVRLLPGGYIVMAPDDLVEPVIAFASTGRLDQDPHNPLLTLLQRDMGKRMATAHRLQARMAAAPAPGDTPARRRWAELQSPPATATGSVSDVRVVPMLTSRWNQSTAGGVATYNYFTPNHDVCGCVATAMSQLIRYWQHPAAGIGVHAFQISVDGAARSVSTRGGDGAGGPYNWSSMPLVPSSSTTDAERQMIGALTFDAGAAVHMAYTGSESGAYMSDATVALRTTFQYANAIDGATGGNIPGPALQAMVEPNLDAGYPVLFGISGTVGGHAIVCDGYGYDGATPTLYHHLNMGWGGASDAWYNLPVIDSAYLFTVIDDCIYNVFPTGTGEIVSGRVTDGTGQPLAGVQVSDGAASALTNAKGIYALPHLAAGTHTFTATKSGLTFPVAVRQVTASADGPSVGNQWGVDLAQDAGATPTIQPQPLPQEVKLGAAGTFTAGATGMGPLHFQWTKNGVPVGTDSPVYTTEAVASADDQAQIQVKVAGSQGQATSAAAPLSVVYLLNGAFESGNTGWSLYNPGVVLPGGVYADIAPHGGNLWLCLGDWAQPLTDFAVQDVTIPAEASAASLSLWMGISNRTKTPAGVTNTFALKVLDTSGHPLQTLLTRDNTQSELNGGMAVWHSYGPYDLSAYKGQTVRLRLESTQPGATDTGTVFAVDDVQLAVTVPHGPKAALAVPGPLTLAAGGTFAFKANVTGAQSDNRVDWSVSGAGGAFNPTRTAGDGLASTLFTAAGTPGNFTVTATPVETGGTAAQAALTLVDPSAVTVNLGVSAHLVPLNTSVTLTANAAPLTDGSVAWSNSGGSFSATTGAQATWSAAVAGTYTLTATSLGAPTRSASAQVQVVDTSAVNLLLTPASATLLPGSGQAFTASGDLGFGVSWSLSPGAAHGSDTATSTLVTVPTLGPLVTTQYTLTATHQVDGAKTATATVTVKGMDLNGDGAVDPVDLLSFAKEWGKGAASPANLKGSGTVNETDLLALLARMN